MSTAVTPTELRSNVYRILDRVLDSGEAQEIVRNGRKLLIVPAQPKRRRLGDLPRRKITRGSFDDLVDASWEDAWDADF